MARLTFSGVAQQRSHDTVRTTTIHAWFRLEPGQTPAGRYTKRIVTVPTPPQGNPVPIDDTGYQSPTGAFFSTLWDTVKLWDNDEVAENYENLRNEERGIVSSSVIGFLAALGERSGVGALENARSGVDKAGDYLTPGQRIWEGTLGLVETALDAVGAKGSAKAAKAAAKEGARLLKAGLDDALNAAKNILGGVVDTTAKGAAKDSARFAKGKVVDAVRTQVHHLATNKGEWGKRFKTLFDKVGIDPDSAVNKMDLPEHAGRHIDEYHRFVFNSLSSAIEGKSGEEAKSAFENALAGLRELLESNPRLPYADGGLR